MKISSKCPFCGGEFLVVYLNYFLGPPLGFSVRCENYCVAVTGTSYQEALSRFELISGQRNEDLFIEEAEKTIAESRALRKELEQKYSLMD